MPVRHRAVRDQGIPIVLEKLNELNTQGVASDDAHQYRRDARVAGLAAHADRVFGRRLMSRWYSPRGARRGLLLAVAAIILWITWAVLYMQGMPDATPTVSPPVAPGTPRVTSQDAACCDHHLRT